MEILVYDPRATNGQQTIRAHDYGARAFELDPQKRKAFDETLKAYEERLEDISFLPLAPVEEVVTDPILMFRLDGGEATPLLPALEATLAKKKVEQSLRTMLHELRSSVIFVEASLAAAHGERPPASRQTEDCEPAMTLEGLPGTGVVPGTGATAAFTLTNQSSAPGTFAVPADTVITGPTGEIPVAGYSVNDSQSFVALVQLQAELANTPVRPGDSVKVAAQYIVPDAQDGQPVFTRFTGVSIVVNGQRSAAVNDFVVDTVSPQPSVAITGAAGSSITPGAPAGDDFALVNQSGQPATFAVTKDALIALPDGTVLAVDGYTLAGKAIHQQSFATPPELNAALRAQTVAGGAALHVGVRYTGPVGKKGTFITTTLSVAANVGKKAGAEVQGSVKDSIGDPPEMQLQGLAASLARASRQNLTPSEAAGLLDKAATTVVSVANQSGSLQVTPQLLAWTLAIDESMQTIFRKVFAQEQIADRREAAIPMAL